MFEGVLSDDDTNDLDQFFDALSDVDEKSNGDSEASYEVSSPAGQKSLSSISTLTNSTKSDYTLGYKGKLSTKHTNSSTKPLLPGTTKRFSDLIEQMTPGNAAIIFKGGMSEETHSLGHFVSLWRATLDENNDSERHFYFFDSIPKNSRAQLLGPWPSTRFNKCFHQTEAILSAFHRDIFVFNLPLDNKRRIEAIEEAMANMNRRFNYVLENYLRVQEFGVTLPINLFSLPVS